MLQFILCKLESLENLKNINALLHFKVSLKIEYSMNIRKSVLCRFVTHALSSCMRPSPKRYYSTVGSFNSLLLFWCNMLSYLFKNSYCVHSVAKLFLFFDTIAASPRKHRDFGLKQYMSPISSFATTTFKQSEYEQYFHTTVGRFLFSILR